MPEWFEEWFGEDYLALYPHRDDEDAEQLIALLQRTLPWVPGWRVVDVGCGPGRHARALERLARSPIGIDLSAILLSRARTMTTTPLVRADMRALPIREGSVDLVANLFTSFGYFRTDAEHAAALREMIQLLRPGGWFVLDFLNAETVRARLVPEESATLDGRPVMIRRVVTPDGKAVRKTISMADGREYLERVRLFTSSELEAMVVAVGGVIRHRFGDYAGAAPALDAPRCLLLAERA